MADRKDVLKVASTANSTAYTVEVAPGMASSVQGLIYGVSTDTAVSYDILATVEGVQFTLLPAASTLNFTLGTVIPFTFVLVGTGIGGTGTAVRLPVCVADLITLKVTTAVTAITNLILALGADDPN